MSIVLIVQILAAVLLLFFGRKLYWFFVGAVGFIAASEWVLMTFQSSPAWMVLLIGLGIGLIGALLSVFARMAGIGVAGFLGGGFILLGLTRYLGFSAPLVRWGAVLVGAVAGVILAVVFFDWALILISSLTGALSLVRVLPLRGLMVLISFLVLAGIGVAVQSQSMDSSSENDIRG